MRHCAFSIHKIITVLVLFSFLFLSSCSIQDFLSSFQSLQETENVPTTALTPQAEITFIATLPAPVDPNQVVYLEVLDELAGPSANIQRFRMEMLDSLHQMVKKSFPISTIIRYRYIMGENPEIRETRLDGSRVKYRLFFVENTSLVQDTIASWENIPPTPLRPSGEIAGQITDISGNFLPGILVSAGGKQALTSADGSFLISGLPPGMHNLVAVNLDGNYQTFQQGAVVDGNSITFADFQLQTNPRVKITFRVTTPQNSIQGMPIRLFGNLLSLGEVPCDYDRGFDLIPSRAPIMLSKPESTYELTLDLPVGYRLRYIYSLGDGIWNSEIDLDGNPVIREFVVPADDTEINDTIIRWSPENTGMIAFRILAPENTPPSDIVSIQFFQGEWAESVPMWPLGNNHWLYVLYSAPYPAEPFRYRFCRNDLCGIADDIRTPGTVSSGFEAQFQKDLQTIEETIPGWAWYPSNLSQPSVVGVDIISRGSSFIAGVEIAPSYESRWQSYFDNGLSNVTGLGANWLVFSPTWSLTGGIRPDIEQIPGRDILWEEIEQVSGWIHRRNLNLAIFPHLLLPGDWQSVPDEVSYEIWLQNWNERYRTYLIHHAIMASTMDAQALILEIPNIYQISQDEPINTIIDYGQFINVISEIRSIYSGSIILAVEYQNISFTPQELYAYFDNIYVLFSEPPVDPDTGELALDFTLAFGKILDSSILPVAQSSGKSILIGAAYPSSAGAEYGCVKFMQDCIEFSELLTGTIDASSSVELDFDIQKKIIEALLLAVDQREWINGFIVRGYYPPAGILDGSISIHDKPASAAIWYWFPRITMMP